jgi:protein SCO1/2
MTRAMMLGLTLAGAYLTGAALALADQSPSVLPRILRDVDIEENLGSRLDPNLRFTNVDGREVALGEYFGDAKPIVLTLAYFRCPMLCDLVLRGVATGFGRLSFRLGDTYRAITISFDPHDRPDQAAMKQASTLGWAGDGAKADGWPFLVGDADTIGALAGSLGFRFAYDPRSKQYAHPAAAFILTPDGRISRYLYGTEFSARDLRLALVEAGAGKVGGIADRILMTCYRFDPTRHRYAPFIRGFMRIGAFMIFVTVVTVLVVLARAGRRAAKGEPR